MSTDPTTDETKQADQPATPVLEKGTDSQPKLSAEEKKAQILKSFEDRLDSGELTLEEVETRQPWVAEAIKSKREKKVEPEPLDKGKLKAEILEELTTKNEFDLIERNFPGEVSEVRKIFSQYKDSLGVEEAMKLAKKLTGVDTSTETLRRQGMRLRELGEGVIESDILVTDEDKQLAKQFSSDPKKVAQRRAILEKGGMLILQ